MKTKITQPHEGPTVSMAHMPRGAVGRIADPTVTGYNGSLVYALQGVNCPELHVVVNLGNPSSWWVWTDDEIGPTLQVQLLPPGTKITLEVT